MFNSHPRALAAANPLDTAGVLLTYSQSTNHNSIFALEND